MPEIIGCPGCGRETYRGVARCPHCGEGLDEVADKKLQEQDMHAPSDADYRVLQKKVFLFVFLACAGFVFLGIYGLDSIYRKTPFGFIAFFLGVFGFFGLCVWPIVWLWTWWRGGRRRSGSDGDDTARPLDPRGPPAT